MRTVPGSFRQYLCTFFRDHFGRRLLEYPPPPPPHTHTHTHKRPTHTTRIYTHGYLPTRTYMHTHTHAHTHARAHTHSRAHFLQIILLICLCSRKRLPPFSKCFRQAHGLVGGLGYGVWAIILEIWGNSYLLVTSVDCGGDLCAADSLMSVYVYTQ